MRGFSVLELLIALTIMTATITTVVLVTVGTPRVLGNGIQEEEAIADASAALARSFATDELPTIDAMHSHGALIQTTALPLTDKVSTELDSTLVWPLWGALGNVGHQKHVKAVLTDLASPPLNGCDELPRGNWSAPQYQTLSLGAFPVSALTVGTTTLFAAASSTVNKTDPKLRIFDLSTAPPSLQSTMAFSTTTRSGIAAMAVAGTQIFVASSIPSNFSSCTESVACAQIQVFSLGSSSPPLEDVYQFATTSPPYATGSGGQSIGKSIAYASGYLYVGLAKSSSAQGEEFNVLDVHDPAAITWLGGVSIERSITKIVVRGAYAYLATDDPQRALVVLDVHDPAHISLLSSYGVSNTVPYGYGRDIAVSGLNVLLGRSYIPSAPELVLLSAATSSNPIVQSSITTSPKYSGVVALLVRSFLVYVLSDTSFQIWNSSDPAHLVPYSAPFQLPAGSIATALTCRGNTLYIASIGADRTGYLTTVTSS